MGRLSTYLWFNANLAQTFQVPAGSTMNLDVDMQYCPDGKFQVVATYPTTSGTAGLTLKYFDGFMTYPEPANSFPQSVPCKLGNAGGPTTATHGTSVVTYSASGTSVPLSAPTTNSSNSQTMINSFSLANANTTNARWQELSFVNTDTTNAVTVAINFEY